MPAAPEDRETVEQLLASVLSPKEAAQRYHKGLSTIYKWVAEGALPSLKVGGVVAIFEPDLQALLARRSSIPLGAPPGKSGRRRVE